MLRPYILSLEDLQYRAIFFFVNLQLEDKTKFGEGNFHICTNCKLPLVSIEDNKDLSSSVYDRIEGGDTS